MYEFPTHIWSLAAALLAKGEVRIRRTPCDFYRSSLQSLVIYISASSLLLMSHCFFGERMLLHWQLRQSTE
ncbi:hypothetical protein B0H19DRAFT_1133506, partial [Mycena capillaripes]